MYHKIWYLSHRREAKAQMGMHIYPILPEPSMHAHIEKRHTGLFRAEFTALAPLDSCACMFSPAPNTLRLAKTLHRISASECYRAKERVCINGMNTKVLYTCSFNIVLTLNAPIATKVVCFSHLLKCLRSLCGKQCGPKSDCSYRSSLF